MKPFYWTSPKPESTEAELLLVLGWGQSEEKSTGHCWPCLGASKRWKSAQDGTEHPKGCKEATGGPAALDYATVLNHLRCGVKLSQQPLRGVSRGLPCTSGCTNDLEPFLTCTILRNLCAWLTGSSRVSQELNVRRKEEKLQKRERLGFCLFTLTQKLTLWRRSWETQHRAHSCSPALDQLSAHFEGSKPVEEKQFWGKWGAWQEGWNITAQVVMMTSLTKILCSSFDLSGGKKKQLRKPKKICRKVCGKTKIDQGTPRGAGPLPLFLGWLL